jgi:hypothetical protein
VDTTPASARSAVAFLWSEQTGLFELAYEPNKRRYFTKHEALNVLDQHRYFAPLARKKRGSKKSDVADTGNVLWADIDDLNGLDERLRRLLPLSPSLVVFSGMKGYWVYLKFTETIPTDEIEILNRGLEALLGADSCHNRDRLARLPGSIHQDSGKLAGMVEFSGLVYSYADLAFLRDLAPSEASRSTEAVFDGTAPSLTSFPTEFPALSHELRFYIEYSPRRGEYGYDRSEMEQKIFTALAYQGWTDEEIITFATVYRLPRHLQEWMRHRDYRWTKRSLRSAREYVAANPKKPSKRSITKTMCIGSDSKTGYSRTDRNEALRLVTGTQTTKELVTTWMNELPTQPRERTAYRMLRQFKDGGYISKEGKRWRLTDLGIHHTQTKMNYLMPLPKIPHKQAS